MNILLRELKLEISGFDEALEYEELTNGALTQHYWRLHKKRKKLFRIYKKLSRMAVSQEKNNAL